ncbi:hypothetical protein EVG20_g761 [Dentipellis fragilis]|uniref:Uncharacterized protein n=1 Tax=Dentipellis fragilis TaxID=205917 RepID=A0A4Y9ZBP1_9AGAM|nr:hypothetical protein EVG20_g761 [Dentipellis fragilis]
MSSLGWASSWAEGSPDHRLHLRLVQHPAVSPPDRHAHVCVHHSRVTRLARSGGAGPRGALATLSQYMLSSAATFSFFLAIGSVIRNDAVLSPQLEAARMQFGPAIVHGRADGASLIRARWAAERKKQARAARS